jgi:Yip1 domain
MPVGPAATGFIQLALLVVMVFAVFWIGRAMGGTGSFEESILLVAWLQFVMVCLQVVQTGVLLVSTTIAEIFGLLGIVLFLWLLTNFVAVLHGFTSLFKVFVMILVSAFGIAFGLSILLTLIGVTMPMVAGA